MWVVSGALVLALLVLLMYYLLLLLGCLQHKGDWKEDDGCSQPEIDGWHFGDALSVQQHFLDFLLIFKFLNFILIFISISPLIFLFLCISSVR